MNFNSLMNFYHFALNSEIHKVIIFVNINYSILKSFHSYFLAILEK